MAIDIGCLSVRNFEGISYLKDIDMSVTRNEHAICNVKAALKSNYNIERDYDENKIVVVYNKENGENIFCGYISELNYEETSIEIQLISCSVRLDIEKVKRTFQKVTDTYKNVLNQLACEAQEDVLINCDYEKKIMKPLYQYNETTWEFFKRISSSIQSAIFPNISNINPVALLGIQDTTQSYNEVVLERHQNKSNELTIVCYENLHVGMHISYDGSIYDIVSKKGYIEKGILLFKYKLAFLNAYVTSTQNNKDIIGLVLTGNVDDVETNKIKVKFDIDEPYQTEAAFNYPWETIMGNMLYCMPEKKSQVAICINDETGSKARGITCLYKDGVGFDRYQKVFATPDGKKMLFSNDFFELSSVNKEGQAISICFKEKEGIIIKTPYHFNLSNFLGRIALESEELYLSALEHVIIAQKTDDFNLGEIALNTTIEISGKVVEMEGITRLTHLAFDDAPTEIVIDGAKWLKLLVKLAITAAVVALACVAAVYLAPVIATAAVGAAGAATVSITTGTIVKGVILTCAIAGAINGACAVHNQRKEDKAAGIKRNFEDYLYMFCDKFCTGAMTTAPMAMVGIPMSKLASLISIPKAIRFKGFGCQMLGTGLSSGISQFTDWILDEKFGGDFYDEDSSVISTLLIDVFANALGEAFSACGSWIVSKGGALYKSLFKEELKATTRTVARQYLRKTVGVDAMKDYKVFLEGIKAKNIKFAKYVDIIERVVNDGLLAYFNSDLTGEISSGTGETYQEMEVQQYFEFRDGELVLCE